MSESSRALPDQPNLRYLKVEAKRRLAAGEFASLHDAQLTIAREHGMSSWTALKTAIDGRSAPVVRHLNWLTERFQGAESSSWVAPEADELREHFDDRYLDLVPAETLIRTLRLVAPAFGAELVVAEARPGSVRAQVADLRVEAMTEPEPPHRLARLRVYRMDPAVSDRRAANPVTTGTGPGQAIKVAEESFSELGLPGLVLAGTSPDGGPWALARGWADLDRPEPMRVEHRFPAYGTTKLITATAILRLVADRTIDLDDPANTHLRTIRLAEAVTVRELLTHTGGVPSPSGQFADRVPDHPLDPVVRCDHRRGEFVASNGGYAVLGQLLADVTGRGYPEAAAELVLRPLGMTASDFPVRWPETGAITGYRLGQDGTFEPAPAQVSTLPAAGGLWTTAADLVRFGAGWTGLLPGELVAEAVRPQVAPVRPGAAEVGLGWLVNPAKDVSGHPGSGPGAAASLIVGRGSGQVTVALTNRMVSIEPVNARLARPTG